MGILKHFNFKAAGRTIEAAKKDVKRPKDEVADRRNKNAGGKK